MYQIGFIYKIKYVHLAAFRLSAARIRGTLYRCSYLFFVGIASADGLVLVAQ